MTKPGQMIPPDAYPQLVAKGDAARAAKQLRSAITTARGTAAIAEKGDELRAAIQTYVDELEAAGQDYARIREKAHDIRGFAENAGLISSGRIADGLCRYFEEMDLRGAAPEPAIVALHVSAIIRAARARDEIGQLSDVVAKELAALVSRRLTEL